MSSNSHLALGRLNLLSPGEAENELLKCCGSRSWAQRLINERPFKSLDDLLAKADRIWWSLGPDDWLEAFRSHPKIGEKKAEHQTSPEAQHWSEQEQSGTRGGAQETMRLLAELNDQYEAKFGYIFIICASGKSSDEMLARLRERLKNDPQKELPVAAREQALITQLRLRKLVAI